jgi:hypothetical protein
MDSGFASAALARLAIPFSIFRATAHFITEGRAESRGARGAPEEGRGWVGTCKKNKSGNLNPREDKALQPPFSFFEQKTVIG